MKANLIFLLYVIISFTAIAQSKMSQEQRNYNDTVFNKTSDIPVETILANSVRLQQVQDSIAAAMGIKAGGNILIPANFNWNRIPPNLAYSRWLITYNHIINSDIAIPAGVILDFCGGSIKGIKTLIGHNTRIMASDYHIISAATISGTWTTDKVWFRWFGAKGNDMADDYESGQQLLNWAASNGKLKVWVGKGLYRLIASGLTVRTSMEGSGDNDYNATVGFKNMTRNGYGLLFDEWFINIDNLSVWGNGSKNGSLATCGDGIRISGMRNDRKGIGFVTMHNVSSLYNKFGLRFTGGCWLINIYDSNFSSNLIDGVNIDSTDGYPKNTGQKNAIQFYGCRATNNGRNGFTSWGMTHHFNACNFEQNKGAGIAIDQTLCVDRSFSINSFNTSIRDCHFEANGHGAIVCKAGTQKPLSTFNYIVGLVIENNYIYDNAASMLNGYTNSILFEGFGEVTEIFGAIKKVRITNNSFLGNLPVVANCNNLLDESSNIDFPTDSHYLGFGRASNAAQMRELVINGYFHGKGAIWNSPLHSETIPSGSVITFPLDLPTQALIRQYKLYVSTDAKNYSIIFKTKARDASAGVEAYGLSLITSDTKSGLTGSQYVQSSEIQYYSLSSRVLPTKNDMYLEVTITIKTPGTFFYIGNLVVSFR